MRTTSASGARRARFHRSAASIATSLLVALVAADARAAAIVGGSDLLDATSATQLETWLGHGAITLINVFDKVAGDTSESFHAAADGKGATFSLIEVTGFGGIAFDAPVLIGGYNPQSWSSDGGWNFTPNNVDRTSFLFNLSQTLLFRQRLGTDGTGDYQTYNHSHYGPTFGSGHDMYVNNGLDGGYSNLFSYATDAEIAKDMARYPASYDGTFWQVGQFEVFTISAVPEPTTGALTLAGLVALAFAAKRRSGRSV